MLDLIDAALGWVRGGVMSFAASHWVAAAILVLGLSALTVILLRRRRRIFAALPLIILVAFAFLLISAVAPDLRQVQEAAESFVLVHWLATAVIGLVVALLILWRLPLRQTAHLAAAGVDAKDVFDARNRARVTLAQIFAGILLLAGAFGAWRQVGVATEGQVTERFTKAIDQLGSGKLEIRLGGIYALERIARDSSRDHRPIMEILTAFVRENARWKEPERAKDGPASHSPEKSQERPPADIQAILTVIGRRELWFGQGEEQGLDLGFTDIAGADLRGAHLEKTRLSGAHLEGADLDSAHLDGARLRVTHLEGADLSDAVGLTQRQIDSAITDDETQLPAGIVRRSETTPTPQPPSQPKE